MSHHYQSTTFTLSAEEIPGCFNSANEMESFIGLIKKGTFEGQRHIRYAYEVGDTSLVLRGSSRSGWFGYAMELFQQARGAPALDFLTPGKFDQRIDVTEGCDLFTRLDEPRIDAAISDIESLLDWAKSHPSDLSEFLPGYEHSGQKHLDGEGLKLIIDASQEKAISSVPDMDIPFAEDGTGPEYFFAFLRTLLVILKFAQQRKMSVVHFQQF